MSLTASQLIWMWWRLGTITCLLTCCSVCRIGIGCTCLPSKWWHWALPTFYRFRWSPHWDAAMLLYEYQAFLKIFSLILSNTSVFRFILCFLAIAITIRFFCHCYYTVIPYPVSWQMIYIYIHSFVLICTKWKVQVKQKTFLDNLYCKLITEGVIILKWRLNKSFPDQVLMAIINLLTCSLQ